MPLQLLKKDSKIKPQDLVVALTQGTKEGQLQAASNLVQDAKLLGCSVDAALAMHVEGNNGLNGLEATFQALNVPVNHQGNEVAMACFAAATGTFMTNDGLRVLLPALINNLLRAAERAPIIERIDDIIFGTRLVKANEMQKEISWDRNTTDSFKTHRIAEGANIPRRELKASQTAVNFFKTGHAIEMSYEFAGTVTPDVLIPYASRIEFERSRDEHALAVSVLVNGESANPTSINGAIKEVDLDVLDGKPATALRNRAEGFLKWIIQQSRAGLQFDTLLVGWDTLMELQLMFPVTNANNTPAAGVGGITGTGTQLATLAVKIANGVNFNLNLVITSQLTGNKLIGFRKAETIERLIKTNSQIAETERMIGNQTILYTNTIISGFTLAYGDTRTLLKWTT